MRIVLVHPTGSNWIAGKKDASATANRMAPIGLLSIAAYLEREGHHVSVYDCLGSKTASDNQSNAKRILEYGPDMVGFSTTTSAFLDAYDLAERIKFRRPWIKIVFGGVHISAWGAILPKHFRLIDYLCVGEGERTMAELADGRDEESITGLVYRNGDAPSANPPRPQIPDLDSLPFPAYGKLPGFPRDYPLPLFSYIQSPGATMITSRGCPYQCSYCDRSVFKRGYRYNSAEYIYEHLRYLGTDFGVRHITIYDDLFTTNRKRIAELCEMLATRPLGMQFNCAVRVGHADEDLLRILKRAGFLQLSVGIETGDPALLEIHKPGVYLDEVRDTVRRIRANGMRAKGLFMMGLPGETEASVKKTGDFIMSLGLDDMNLAKFTPFYGAPVWAGISEQGEFDHDWRKMNCLNFVFVPKAFDSKETLDRLYNQHVKRFYSDRTWRRNFVKHLPEHRKSIFHFARHLPTFLGAMRNFEPEQAKRNQEQEEK